MLLEKLLSRLVSADTPAPSTLNVDVFVNVDKLLEFIELCTEISGSFGADCSDLILKERLSVIICFSELDNGKQSKTN